MRAGLRTRWTAWTILTGVAIVAGCRGDGPSANGAEVPRSRLNGDYTCVRFEGFFHGPQGPGTYEGTCEGYANATVPSRRDSTELAPFSIGEDNTISRQEFPPATVAYDSAARRLTATDASGRVDIYDVVVQGETLFLIERFPPFDFSGDGRADELTLIYRRR